MQFNFRHFKILQLEKLALFNLAYFCHPPIKPKFPSRQNYPIYGMTGETLNRRHAIPFHIYVFLLLTAVRSSMPEFYEKMKNRLRTADEGADTLIWLAMSDAALNNKSGLFFQGNWQIWNFFKVSQYFCFQTKYLVLSMGSDVKSLIFQTFLDLSNEVLLWIGNLGDISLLVYKKDTRIEKTCPYTRWMHKCLDWNKEWEGVIFILWNLKPLSE